MSVDTTTVPKKKEAALVLPVEAATVAAPVTFPPFPGEYAPGEPVAISSLGISADEAAAMIEDMNLPLEKDTVTVQSEEAVLAAEHSREELNALAAEAGIADPESFPSKSALAEAIAEAEPVVHDIGEPEPAEGADS